MKNILILLIVLVITGCGGVNPLEGRGDSAGFFMGLWDGFSVLISLIGKMFGAQINMYEVFNNGNWYNLGFLIGAGLFFGIMGGL